MTERINPFASLTDAPTFSTKPKADKPVEEETIKRIAEQNNFPSRQATKPPKAERRKPRVHRTGRNVQFNAKVTAETHGRIHKLADAMTADLSIEVPLGEVLKRAIDALERERAAKIQHKE